MPQTSGINFNPALNLIDVLRKLSTPQLAGVRDVYIVSRPGQTQVPTSNRLYGIFGERTVSPWEETGIRGSDVSTWSYPGNSNDFTGTPGSTQYINGVGALPTTTPGTYFRRSARRMQARLIRITSAATITAIATRHICCAVIPARSLKSSCM